MIHSKLLLSAMILLMTIHLPGCNGTENQDFAEQDGITISGPETAEAVAASSPAAPLPEDNENETTPEVIPTAIAESFTGALREPRDLIFILDSTISMFSENNFLGPLMSAYAEEINNSPIKVGKVFILYSPTAQNLNIVFNDQPNNVILVPSVSDSDEMVTDLTNFLATEPALTPEANLEVIFITDEEIDAPQLNLFPTIAGKQIRPHAVVGLEEDNNDGDCRIGEEGANFVRLVTQLKGSVTDICSESFEVLNNFLIDTTEIKNNPFQLTQTPVDGTELTVSVNGQTLEKNNYLFDKEQLSLYIFDQYLPVESEVIVNYSY